MLKNDVFYDRIRVDGENMYKLPIGIIDMNNDNISILDYLRKELKYENLIYINDLKQYQYEGLTPEAIIDRVKRNIDILISLECKLLVVISSTIIEYCQSYLKKLPIPVISIVDTIIDFVNEKYEHKNMAFLASQNIIEASLYQKRFKYNHLYNLPSDSLDDVIINKQMKTSVSFNLTKEVFKSVQKKDIDIIIPTTANMMLLKTEINEYMPFINIVNIPEIICDEIKEVANDNLYHKRKGKTYIYINVPKKESNFQHLLTSKYKIKYMRGE